MDDARLAYRVRTAEPGDDARLRASIGATLAHPDRGAKRESYRGAVDRGDILVLERHDRQEREWHVAGFVEYHMRVDDTLSIRDVGTAGDEPQVGVVRYLLDQLFGSFKPSQAQVKIRRDASAWLEIFGSAPGFYLEGEEYRRPHYWTIWRWDPEHAREARRAPGRPEERRAPRPPRPPGERPAERRTPSDHRPLGPRPGGRPPGRPGAAGPRRPPGPSGDRRADRGSR